MHNDDIIVLSDSDDEKVTQQDPIQNEMEKRQKYDHFDGGGLLDFDEQEIRPTTSQSSNQQIIAKEQPKKEDDNEAPAKRKKRTKEEIEQEKLAKEISKIRRQIISSKNSKCEHYLFCHFSTRILNLDEQLNDELRKRFDERGIQNQITFDNSPALTMRIIWKRKRIDPFMEDGKVVSREIMELQDCFCCVLSGDTFTILAKTKNGVLDYLRDQTKAHKTREPRPTLIILGKHTLRENTVDSIIFEAYERLRVQFRFVKDALDFSFLITQMHRALAKAEKKTEKQNEAEELGTTGSHFLADKGQLDGPEMVADWWAKMLDHIHRLSEEQKRAIVQAHPNPLILMELLLRPTNSPGNSMFQLSEIQMESGRRLGPVLAQKIYKMLTSNDGREVIDAGD